MQIGIIDLKEMGALRNLSTHWSFHPKLWTTDTDRDYAQAEFKQLDVLTFVEARICKQMAYGNICGHARQQCSVAWGHKKILFLTHRSDVNDCDPARTPGFLVREQTFGRYREVRSRVSVTTKKSYLSKSATTNHWFGS